MHFIYNNLLYLSKQQHNISINQSHTKISRKFNIKGIKDTFLSNEIKNMFNLNELETISGEMSKKDIDKLVNNIRSSGFFKQVQLRSIIINNTQMISLDLIMNPYLQNINFINNQNLLIPQNLLLKFFSNQIGYPKSLKKIHNSIQEIYKWYHKKGFKWVKIEIENCKNNQNTINIKILEGKIHSIQFNSYDINQNTINTQNYEYLIKLLRKYLKLKEEERINYYEIENRIAIIKEKKILDNCDYKITYSNKKNNRFNIIINIYSLPYKATYLIGKNITLSTDLREIIEANLFNSINKIINSYIKLQLPNDSIQYNKTHINPKSKILTSVLYLKNITDKYSIEKIKSIMIDRKSHLFIELYEWYINSIFMNTNHNIKLKHYIKNLTNNQEYINLELKIPDITKQFNFILYFPWFYLIRAYPGQLKIKILQNSFTLKNSAIIELLNPLAQYSYLLNNSILNIKDIQIKLEQTLSNNIAIQSSLGINNIHNRYMSLKNKYYNLVLNSKKLKYFAINKNCLFLLSYIRKNILYKYLWINLEINYNTKNENNIKNINKGIYFKLISKIFFPINIIYKPFNKYYHDKFVQKLIIKSTIFNSYNSKNINNNKKFIISNIELGMLFGSANFLPVIEDFILSVPNTIRGYNECWISLPKVFYKLNLEYHKTITKFNNIFAFFDYIYIIPRKSKCINSDISKILFTNNTLDKYRIHSSIGIGISFRIPIKKIPEIRLEYGINISQNIYSHLRVASEIYMFQ
uniref:hypothetical protein n=1 Tax=Pulvinaster venetus TaxID=427767 RepID=UPI001FCD0BEC|nr:hypothetical protein MW436_pgp146 [Pulvinaster venetus]UNJ16913.1 hypothetical protein [Pulvinaster venetus]